MKQISSPITFLLLYIVVSLAFSSVVLGQTKRKHSNSTLRVKSTAINVDVELEQLRGLSKANKIKVKNALSYLEKALTTATVSNDLNEIGNISQDAEEKTDLAVSVLPNGRFKGTLISCQKALGHSFIVRSFNEGKINSDDEEIQKLMSEITIRYELTKFPKYERVAKVLDYAKAFLEIIKERAIEADIKTN